MIALPDLSLPIAETAIRATLVLVGALGIALLLRQASGSARHSLWTVTTGALLALPLLQGTLPTLAIGWFPTRPAVETVALVPADVVAWTVEPGVAGIEMVTEPSPIPVEVQEHASLPWGRLLTLVWLFGVVALIGPTVIGHARARRLVRGARPCHDGRLLVRFVAAAHAAGVRESVRLLFSDAVRTPMTGGLVRSVVVLPVAATGWSDDCLDAVFRHELVHVRRRDTWRQLAARIAVALYWFHPLAWRAARLGALAREQAADEAVVVLGARPSRYARHLLDLADPAEVPGVVPALIRLDHTHLEERVMAILRASPTRTSRRQQILATLGIAAWTLCVAAAGPATAQIPRAPTPPAAPAAPTPPTAAAMAIAEAPLPPMAAPAPVAAPPAPAAPAVPLAGRYDCEPVGGGYRSGSSDRSVPVRMHTSVVDGIRICAAVRGRTDETATFLPIGRVPVGVLITLASSGPDGEQRLEIAGTNSGNSHTWTVNGRERPFDAAAAEWRDAMVALVQASIEKSRVRDASARGEAEVARMHAQESRAHLEADRAAVRERAVVEARAHSEIREAHRADEQAVQASEHARQIAEVERVRQRDRAVEARGVADVRQAEAEARRQDMERNRVEQRRAVREVVEARTTDAQRAVEERRAVAENVRRAQESEQRAAQVQQQRRVAEVDARMAPLAERLKRAIDRVAP
jgi:beta-lactamase regulating signal transducer with metallopeptidase domain